MKRIIKTLEELRATDGVVEGCAGFLYPIDGATFTVSMREFCGKEVTDAITDGWELSPWMWKEVEDSPAEGLEFPCDMLVWNDGDKPVEIEVHAYVPTLGKPWVTEIGGVVVSFKNAKPIEFKPRYMWVKVDEDSKAEPAQEIREGVYVLTGKTGQLHSTDIYEIGDDLQNS